MTRIFNLLTDTLFPRQCTMCDRRLSTTESILCMDCQRHLAITGDHLSPLDNPTARLFWGRTDVERVVAMYSYRPNTRLADAIYRMKYGNMPEVGETMAIAVAGTLAQHGFFDNIDIIIPLPLHRKREVERGYNQSYFIARGLQSISHLPIRNDIVKRQRNTPSQTSLNHNLRQNNMEGAFRLLKPSVIESKHVLLVDDIITTGASMLCCTKTLHEANNVTISIFALAHPTE